MMHKPNMHQSPHRLVNGLVLEKKIKNKLKSKRLLENHQLPSPAASLLRGDNEWESEDILPYGAILAGKEQNVLRAALQNINGISYSAEHIALEEIDAMYKYHIDLLRMTEINIAMSLERRLQLASALQMRFTGSRVVSSSMKSKDEGYLPGGTTTIAQGPLSGRVFRRGSDHMGRFSWMALRGTDGTGIIVITGYRVCQNKGTVAGTNTAYMREWGMLRSEGVINPDPRLMVLRTMSEVLHEWMNRGYHPLVMITANENHLGKILERAVFFPRYLQDVVVVKVCPNS
eukprot:scaffold226749_cov66-Cyclotella_meneghiniana.AAC.2